MALRNKPGTIAAIAVVSACAFSGSASGANPGGFTYATTQPSAGPGGTLVVRSAALLDRTLHIRGTMASGAAGRSVLVQRRDKDGVWTTTGRATTKTGGTFIAKWKTNHIGHFPIRAFEITPVRSQPTGSTTVTVYKPGFATYFGTGLFGRQMACGKTLTRRTLGVAHRTLPCGTMVALYYKGRSMRVAVVDRGPFRRNTTWDLTEATATALRMRSSSTIGAVRAP